MLPRKLVLGEFTPLHWKRNLSLDKKTVYCRKSPSFKKVWGSRQLAQLPSPNVRSTIMHGTQKWMAGDEGAWVVVWHGIKASPIYIITKSSRRTMPFIKSGRKRKLLNPKRCLTGTVLKPV